MDTFNFRNSISSNSVPRELLSSTSKYNDVNIFIGENGSGKSTFLYYIANKLLNKGKNVIAIANSIHDKFELRHNNFKALRGRAGRKQAKNAIKYALSLIGGDDIKKLSIVTNALRYVNFQPVIGLRLNHLRPNFKEIIDNTTLLNPSEKEELIALLYIIEYEKDDDITFISMEKFSFEEVKKSPIIKLFKREGILKKLKIINSIEVFLIKGDSSISLFDASSGELSIISSIIFLSTLIDENSVILIDEPENSLHPKWQKDYVNRIMDLFHYYQPKIIIATHSPLIVSGAESSKTDVNIYKAENFMLELQVREAINLEEMLYRLFDLATPQNRYLSERIVRLLNVLAEKRIDFDSFRNAIIDIQSNSYDPLQQEVLRKVIELAKKIE